MDTIAFKPGPSATRIHCYGGGDVDVIDPAPEDFTIGRIAGSLSKLCRFTGHCQPFYAVATHANIVSQLCEKAALALGWQQSEVTMLSRWGLLHDAAEMITGDLSRPIKSKLSIEVEPGYSMTMKAFEVDLLGKVAKRWGLPPEVPALVAEMDNLALRLEFQNLFQQVTPRCSVSLRQEFPRLGFPESDKPFLVMLMPQCPEDARLYFLWRASALGMVDVV